MNIQVIIAIVILICAAASGVIGAAFPDVYSLQRTVLIEMVVVAAASILGGIVEARVKHTDDRESALSRAYMAEGFYNLASLVTTVAATAAMFYVLTLAGLWLWRA